MLKHSILIFLGFLAVTSIAFTLEKNFFFLPFSNGLASKIFQSRSGITAYSTDLMAGNTYAPHYVNIDLEASNVTEILGDLITACGQGPASVDRLHYHVLTYTWVYYCTSNNSILLLESQNYEVQTVISLSINETFDEVRLNDDGYSVSIVGISGLFSETPNPSHLIIISLQTQAIVNHVVFDHSFAAGEAVTAFDTNGISMYIITNTVNNTINIANVYQMTLIGNSYSLTNLTTFSSTGTFVYTLPEFYVIKNLIFTSSGENLVVVNINGNIQGGIENVALNTFPNSRTTYVYRPVIISFPGIGSVFVSLNNYTLLEVAEQGQGYNVQNQGTFAEISLAIQYQLTSNMLFYFGGDYGNFIIDKLDTPLIHYQSVANFTNFMITDKTYSGLQINNLLLIFDLQTNNLIKAISVTNNNYYDPISSTFSFLIFNQDENKYLLQQVDLRTGNVINPLAFSFVTESSVQLVHATNNENFSSPQLVIHAPTTNSDEFLIVSQSLGQVHFVPNNPSPSVTNTLAVDYDTLTVFYFQNAASQALSVTEYNYVSSNSSFVIKNTNQNLVRGNIIPATDYSVITSGSELLVIDMSVLNVTQYSIPAGWTAPSTFQNSTNGFNVVLSQEQQWGADVSQPAGILYKNQIQALPGITSNTVQAGTAGTCSYWVVNQVGSFANVLFYNICDSDTVSEIIA